MLGEGGVHHLGRCAIAVAALAAGCAGEGETAGDANTAAASPAQTVATEPDDGQTSLPTGNALIATATVDQVDVFAAPNDDERMHRLSHPNAVGAPRTFLVDERRGDWLKVLLPVRPNGSTGWIRADDVTLSQTGYAIEVDLANFELRVRDDGDIVTVADIGYGDEATPTPGGRYYVVELLQPPNPDGPYGLYAFGLSGFSDVHRDFAGGEGVIGIHGTNAPASIGRRVSNGCIRVAHDVIAELAELLPLGTPVTILG